MLQIQNLSLCFNQHQVLNKVNFSIKKGEIIGIVGESGSGKSVSSLAIMGLLTPNAEISKKSKILFENNGQQTDLLQLSRE